MAHLNWLLLLLLLLAPCCLCRVEWPELWCLNGTRQSPIALTIAGSRFLVSLPTPRVSEPTVGQAFAAADDSHAGLLLPDSAGFVDLGDGFAKRRPRGFHWHWGGSEHRLNGRQLAAESHLVLWNSELYKSFEQAAVSPLGLAVVGVLYEESSQPSVAMETALEHLAEGFGEGLRLKLLLPSSLSRFYRYNGSSTTPKCRENVLWTVLADPVLCTRQQLERLRQAGGGAGSNWRGLQALNSMDSEAEARQLLRSFAGKDVPTKDVPTKNVSTKDVSTKDVSTNVSTKDVSTKNVSTKNVSTKNVSTKDTSTRVDADAPAALSLQKCANCAAAASALMYMCVYIHAYILCL